MIRVGDRVWERDRGGDAMPRGGVVLELAGARVVVARAWGYRAKGRTPHVAYLEVEVLELADLNPDAVEQLGQSERMRLARAVAAVMGERKSTGRTDADERDVERIRALMADPDRATDDHPFEGGDADCQICGEGRMHYRHLPEPFDDEAPDMPAASQGRPLVDHH